MDINLTPQALNGVCRIRKTYVLIDLFVIIATLFGIYASFNSGWVFIFTIALLCELSICAKNSIGRLLVLSFANRRCKECIHEIQSFHNEWRDKYTWSNTPLSLEAQKTEKDYDRLLPIMQDIALSRRKVFKQKGWWINYLGANSDPFIDPILRLYYKEEEISKWRTTHPKTMKLGNISPGKDHKRK